MEARRILLNRQTLLLILGLMALNILLFVKETVLDQQINDYSLLKYYHEKQLLLKDIASDPAGMAGNAVAAFQMKEEKELAAMSDEKMGAYYRMEAQWEYLNGFSGMVENTMNQKQELGAISIFAQSGFSSKNTEKTAADYGRVAAQKMSYGTDELVSNLLGFAPVHYIYLLFMLYVILRFEEERKKGFWNVVYAAPQGRGRMALRRAVTLLLAAFLSGILLFGSMFLVNAWITGVLPDGGIGLMAELSRSAQSMECLKGVTLPVSAGVFLVLYLLGNCLFMYVASLLIWSVLSAFRIRTGGMLILAVVAGTEYVLYHFLMIQSNWNLLKYMNIFLWLNPTEYFTVYRNLNVAGHPVGLFVCGAAAGGMVAVLCLLSAWITACRLRPVAAAGKMAVGLAMAGKMAGRAIGRLSGFMNVFCVEIYKILISQKGILAIGLLIYLCAGTFRIPKVYYSAADTFINRFYEKYEGPCSKEALDYLAEKQAQVDSAAQDYESVVRQYRNGAATQQEVLDAQGRVEAYTQQGEALAVLSGRIEQMRQTEKNIGHSLWLVNPLGYHYLIGEKSDSGNGGLALELLAFLVLLGAGTFSYEEKSGTRELLRSGMRGRASLFRRKMWAISMLTVLLTCFVYGTEFFRVYRTFGLSGFHAPVQSIGEFATFPLPCPIWAFLAGCMALRIMTALAVSFLTCLVSACFSYEKGLLAAFALLVLPSGLCRIGIPVFGKVSLSVPMNVQLALREWSGVKWAGLYLFVIALAIAAWHMTRLRWCGKANKTRAEGMG